MELIASFWGYSLIIRVSAAIIGIVAAVLILEKHWHIQAKGGCIEERQALPPPLLNPPDHPETESEQPVEEPAVHVPEWKNLKRCSCGGTPEIIEGYDTIKIVCQRCGKSTETILGDYYDEAFMLATYGDSIAREWNAIAEKEQ